MLVNRLRRNFLPRVPEYIGEHSVSVLVTGRSSRSFPDELNRDLEARLGCRVSLDKRRVERNGGLYQF